MTFVCNSLKKELGMTVKGMLNNAEQLMRNSSENLKNIKSRFEKQIDVLIEYTN